MRNIHPYGTSFFFKGTKYYFGPNEQKEVTDTMRGFYRGVLEEIVNTAPTEKERTDDMLRNFKRNISDGQCKATTKAGTRCKQKALKNQDLCPIHTSQMRKKNK